MSFEAFSFVNLPVFGRIGPGTEMDSNVHPPKVTHFHCLLDALPDSDC
jgi:hypothetical protein